MVRVRRFGGLAITVALIGLWFVALRPTALGGPVTYLVIRGDSMEPTYHTGDLVITRAADHYAVGDVVAYRVPEGEVGAGHLVIHRIVGGDGAAGYLVRGDNNPSVDPWTPQQGNVAGSAWLAIPGFGRLLSFIHQPAALGALAVSVLVAVMLHRTPRRTPERARRRELSGDPAR